MKRNNIKRLIMLPTIFCGLQVVSLVTKDNKAYASCFTGLQNQLRSTLKRGVSSPDLKPAVSVSSVSTEYILKHGMSSSSLKNTSSVSSLSVNSILSNEGSTTSGSSISVNSILSAIGPRPVKKETMLSKIKGKFSTLSFKKNSSPLNSISTPDLSNTNTYIKETVLANGTKNRITVNGSTVETETIDSFGDLIMTSTRNSNGLKTIWYKNGIVTKEEIIDKTTIKRTNFDKSGNKSSEVVLNR